MKMKLIKIIGSSVFQIMSLAFVLGYLLGVLNLYFSDNNNYCLMTYMFEYPQFVRISLPENKIYAQYGLFAYSEGRFTEKARKMWFDGVPVLFLPGNSGSHMQSRSLASVALRKALSKGYSYHFDFFTISFNEEWSGLYGGVLHSQTQFASSCIAKILSLYKSNKYTKTVPNSVILIGHSMGGLVAKRLLAYPSTVNTTSIAITLAAPLEAPVINMDIAMNDYYMLMEEEWNAFIYKDEEIKKKKIIISFGNGPRDVLMPSGLTSSNDSYINVLTTSVPGVWVSPDHVCIVWCKQLVIAINRYLFSIIDPATEQLVDDSRILMDRARQYFQANRSMTLRPDISRPNMTMTADAFWYEDNRRIYQISRPQIDKTTHLMIRLVGFPQNRFVAVESVNVDDKEWIFGCNAKYTYNTYRYCKDAASLSELSRWTGAATDFGRRKLATVNLHTIREEHPDWTHVIVKVSPTRKPIVLNVDINDHASRQIQVELPSDLSFGKTVIKQETEEGSLYYELVVKNLNLIHQAYLLYVEPTASCKATQYHVSAELHVPWARNQEYYHYFTHLKQNPMKLRLYKSNPNVTNGLASTEHVKITLLLDPQCTYTISISSSWYHRLAQLARNYSPALVPYVAGIVLLAARSNMLHLRERGACVSVHRALMSESVKPYYALVFARFGAMAFVSVPLLSFLFENASWKNVELQYFTRSLVVVPAYMTALGILNIAVAAIMAVMVFSSQIAHRLLFRIVWRGGSGSGLAEKVASGLQKVPLLVSGVLVCAAPVACGAAALAVGAAFYAFMLSKMYEEYLEDYFYKIMAKIASRICYMFKSKSKSSETSLVKTNSSDKLITDESKDEKSDDIITSKNDESNDKAVVVSQSNNVTSHATCEERNDNETNDNESNDTNKMEHVDIDEDLNNLNFHMMMFLMWLTVTLVNVPALLTWARNFSYSMVLKPDTSYNTGLVMSACSICIWQIKGPRRNLRYYDGVSSLLFTMAVFILALGPLHLTIVNYGVTFMFVVITLQQALDREESTEDNIEINDKQDNDNNEQQSNDGDNNENKSDDKNSEEKKEEPHISSDNLSGEGTSDDCNVCNENRIFNTFKNLREKLNFSSDL